MSGGVLFDLALLALLAATGLLLYRLRLASPLLAETGDSEADERTFRQLGRFPTVARQAGFEPGRLRWFYWLAKLALAATLPLLFLELPTAAWLGAPLLWVVGLALLGFLLPNLWLLLRRRRRQRRVRRALSYFLDLLVALLYSGLSLEEAFRRAGHQGLSRSHPLAREVQRTSRELEAGQDRATAFQALAERTGVAELRSVAVALGLAVRHGTSVESALETQADLLRTKQREGARREIAAAATKAIFPVFLCGFPVFFVIIFFPAILEMIEAFRALVSLF